MTDERPEITLLRDLLSIDTTNPPGNEGPAAEVLRDFLAAAGFDCTIHTSPGGRANLVARLDGPRDRPALVLVSHTDVVPVERDRWSAEPFGGEVRDGFVWGRGALDMKGIAAMHALAAADLARTGDANREVIVVSVADEEAGGAEGAGWLMREHADLIGFGDGRPPPDALGEGAFGLEGLFDRPVMPIALGEKKAVRLKLTARGEPGHGALPPARQAPVLLAAAIGRVAGYGTPRVHPIMREQFDTLAPVASGAQAAVLKALASPAGPVAARLLARKLVTLGAIGTLLADTVSPTNIDAGYKDNVIPGEATAALDCRLLPDTDVGAFVSRVQRDSGPDVEVTARRVAEGPVSDRGKTFDALAAASRSVDSELVVVPSLTPGFTDLRHFRKLGARAYGWAPVVLSPDLLATVYGHDERIPVEGYLAAVTAMTDAMRGACR